MADDELPEAPPRVVPERPETPPRVVPERPETPPRAMPVFLGNPWVQKYNGVESEVRLTEWRAQIEYLAGLQGLSASQQQQFVLNSLGGEARREVQAAPEAIPATAQTIFHFLTEQYGDTTPVAVLRAQFFNCKQGPHQSIRAFALKLREQYTRLQRRRDHGLGDEETLLRDQFLLGLREGPLRQNLRVQFRRDPELTFDDLKKEAMALEGDQAEVKEAPVCAAVSGPAATSEVTDWKQALKMELLKDVRDQMAELTKALVGELRLGPGRKEEGPAPRERTYSDRGRDGTRRPWQASRPRFEWDEQGRPICNRCGTAGHVSRQCGPRRASEGGF
ncbi:uncharacterized protein [Misgurnus anguillicaudatus]|uniref:uncharacterized protein n=1 Tax=Misgurnus anguillicaudatus TaxID=75329 RepID=UPI003CCF7D22